jgi:uncharacterized protein YxeA
MKRKDILTLIISIVIIALSLYFALRNISPSSNTSTSTNTEDTKTTKGEKTEWQIDDAFYKEEISNLNNYGESGMEGIGRENPFGPIN